MWGSGSRKMPKLTKHDIIHLLPIALFHALARLSPLLVAGAGRVSSTTMVSTMAPLATALLAGRVIREKFPKFVYPILVMSPLLHVFIYFFGAELNVILMTLLSPFLGMVFLCLRNVFSKKLMNEHDVGENMCAENVYAVLSILSLFVMLPFILCFETESVGAAVSMAWENHGFYFVLNILIAGITSYLCNELLFKILGEISPVTLGMSSTATLNTSHHGRHHLTLFVAAVIMSNIFSVCKQALFVLMVETSVIWKSILSIAVLMASTIAYFFVKYRHRSTTPNVESSS